MQELESELDNYFGTLNEIRMGINSPLPDKPAALAYYEQCKELNAPLVDGGILDQPHIWLMQYGICTYKEMLWRRLMGVGAQYGTNTG